MKTIFLSLIMLFLFSCEDEDTTPATPSIPMVKTEELKSYVLGNLQTHAKNTYSYDAQQRVVSISSQNVLNGNTGSTTFNYSTPNQIIETSGSSVKTYTLDANGRTTQIKLGTFLIGNYTYDANGYVQTVSDAQYSTTYTYTNNNITEIKTISTVGVTAGNLQEHEKYSYGTQPNTIGNENKGMKFLGKSSANAIGGRQKVAGSNPLYAYSYISNFDANNLLTYYSWNRTGGNQQGRFEALYTYYP